MIQIALALLGGGVVGSVLSYLQARRRAPIERDSAHAAASREITAAATELIAPLRAEVERLDSEVQEARHEAAQARREARDAWARVEAISKVAGEADEYITDLHQRWPIHRTRDQPPPWRWLNDSPTD